MINAQKSDNLLIEPIGLQPSSYFDACMDLSGPKSQTVKPFSKDAYDSGLSATELLYTARGTQAVGVSDYEASRFTLDPSNLNNNMVM